MVYREVLNRYSDNVGVEKEDSKFFRRAKSDLTDTLTEMYRLSEAPKKVFVKHFDSTKDVLEDFADSTYTTGLTLSNLTFDVNRVKTTGTGIVTITDLVNINTVSITVGGTKSGTITDFATGNLTIKDDNDNQLFTQDFIFTDVDVNDEDFVFNTAIKESNIKIILTINIGAGYTDIHFKKISYNTDNYFFTLPLDFFLPLEVKFLDEDGRHIKSNEMFIENYERWNPNLVMPPKEGSLEAVGDFANYYSTWENLIYDRGVGYYFNIDTEGVNFYWKPVFKGRVTIVYSSLPSLDMGDNKALQVHSAFVDTLVYGATVRGLLKRLKDEDNQFKMQALMISIREYKSEYKDKLSDFIAYTRRNADPFMVQPFDFLSDEGMLPI